MRSSGLSFRSDINGLRALAVIPVLFFHADWELFSGGFLGVDVFFVISGFLITSLLLRSFHSGEFSLLVFYDRRMRRILPALFLTCTLSSVLAFFFMLPYDLKNFGQSIVATTLSANNVLLYLTSGYWSLAAEFKPLYHTWSLAVEEQYYALVPLLLLAVYSVSTRALGLIQAVLIILTAVSFSISFFSANSEYNFLIVTHRMWELLVGSLLATLLFKYDIKKSNLLSLSGLLMIIWSYVMPYSLSDRQAIYNLLPVVGTALVIVFSSNSSAVGRFLSIKPLTIIGLLSFSIYLLHMPLLAFLRLAHEGRPSLSIQVLTVLAVIPLAYLSWRYVENVFRDPKRVSGRVFYLSLSLTALGLVSLGLVLHKSYGLQEYSEFSYGNNPQAYADSPRRLSKRAFDDESKDNVLVIGNSFARDFLNMMLENGVDRGYEFIYLESLEDDPILAMRLVGQSDLTISVSSFGLGGEIDEGEVRAKSLAMLQYISAHSNGRYLRIGSKNFGYNNNFVRMRSRESLQGITVAVNDSTLVADTIESGIWGEQYVSIIEAISTDGSRVPLFVRGSRFMSFDTEHVTSQGARYIGEVLLRDTDLRDYIQLDSSS